jgi:hypothetical protein
VWDKPAFCNLSEPFIQAGQKFGFLRDLLEFRTRKFWQLGNDFIEAHLSILAYLDRVATPNITLISPTRSPPFRGFRFFTDMAPIFFAAKSRHI